MNDQPDVFRRSDLTYDTYLKVPDLLSLQVCKSSPQHHDELLFIVIHQAYELWFKMILWELENSMQHMVAGQVLRAHHFLRRVVEIQKLLVSQIHILETMTPIEFLGFRDVLNPASGFQSLQFREIEFIAGLKDESYYKHFEDQSVLAALRARAAKPDLWQTFQTMLVALGYDDVPVATVRATDPPSPERDRLMAALRQIYSDPHQHMEVYLLAEDLIDFDTQLSLWRFHHVNVVERVIGFKRGTGGSSGAVYLRGTIDKRCFPLLWEVRTHLGPAPVYGGASPSTDPESPAGSGCPFGH